MEQHWCRREATEGREHVICDDSIRMRKDERIRLERRDQSSPQERPLQTETQAAETGDSGGGGFSRRNMLLGVAAIGGGWYLFLRDTDDSPEDVTEEYLQTLYDGDAGSVNELLHSDAPVDEFTPEEAAEYRDINLEIQELELVEETDERARVNALVAISFNGDVFEDEGVIELRLENGTWKIWDAP